MTKSKSKRIKTKKWLKKCRGLLKIKQEVTQLKGISSQRLKYQHLNYLIKLSHNFKYNSKHTIIVTKNYLLTRNDFIKKQKYKTCINSTQNQLRQENSICKKSLYFNNTC